MDSDRGVILRPRTKICIHEEFHSSDASCDGRVVSRCCMDSDHGVILRPHAKICMRNSSDVSCDGGGGVAWTLSLIVQ